MSRHKQSTATGQNPLDTDSANCSERELSMSNTDMVELIEAAVVKGCSFRFRAKGWSMFPFIRDGDIIVLSPLASAGPRTGDIVAFRSPCNGSLAIHRIVRVTRGSFIVRGDNNEEPDGLVARKDILAQVDKVERAGKQVALGLGPERFLIAVLSRTGSLNTIINALGSLYRLKRNSFERIIHTK